MDIFAIRDSVVDEYKEFTTSFVELPPWSSVAERHLEDRQGGPGDEHRRGRSAPLFASQLGLPPVPSPRA